MKSRDDLPNFVEANPQDIQLSEAYQYLLKMEQQFKDHVDKVHLHYSEFTFELHMQAMYEEYIANRNYLQEL